jgi:hypothetical protein
MSEINTTKSAPMNRSVAGPFDLSEVSGVETHASFGSIKLVPLEGMDIRLEVEESTQRVLAISIHLNHSSLQLQAFAAPKTEGLWNEIRGQLFQSIRAQGGLVEERIGSFGPELVAQLPSDDPAGPRRYSRFIGVDGPRWFLRGMVSGAAINDPAAASQIETIFRSVVVDRGADPLPPRDLLPLEFPEGIVAPPRMLGGFSQ